MTESIKSFKTLARTISLVENEAADYETLLANLAINPIPIIGITGPPGAGKSTLLNAILGELLTQNKKIGLLLIDPSSPFNLGALLGDRLRMSSHFNHPNLFIRSLATRGSLGGLCDKILEVTDVMKSFPFDFIFVETVGVGQTEVEIAGLADTTVVVLVPEAGDSIQTMKAGLMEIADVFVLNKSDRPNADTLFNSLQLQLHISGRDDIPVLKTIGTEGKGIAELILFFENHKTQNAVRKLHLLTEKALKIIQKNYLKTFDKQAFFNQLKIAQNQPEFNLYQFLKRY